MFVKFLQNNTYICGKIQINGNCQNNLIYYHIISVIIDPINYTVIVFPYHQ